LSPPGDQHHLEAAREGRLGAAGQQVQSWQHKQPGEAHSLPEILLAGLATRSGSYISTPCSVCPLEEKGPTRKLRVGWFLIAHLCTLEPAVDKKWAGYDVPGYAGVFNLVPAWQALIQLGKC